MYNMRIQTVLTMLSNVNYRSNNRIKYELCTLYVYMYAYT